MGDPNSDADFETNIPPFSLLGSVIEKERLHTQVAHLCRVPVSRVVDALPCTPLQGGHLALTAKIGGDYYVEKFDFDIPEEVDIKRFRLAWEQVVAMNPILRTRIVSLPDLGIIQVVLDEGPQWSSSTGSYLEQIDPRGTESMMGLGTPLTKFSVRESASMSHRRFSWEIHHALYDGHSIPLVLKQVEDVYYNTAYKALEPMNGFIDYIMGPNTATTSAFWKAQFLDIQGSLASSFSYPEVGYTPRPDCKISMNIQDLGWSRGNFTASTIIRAAWSLAMAQSMGSNQALFGVIITGRQAPVPNIERIAGPTIATVPVCVTLDWEGSVRGLLDAVQCQATHMIPFEQTGLQRIRRMNEDTEIACNFQTLLIVQPAGSDRDEPRRPFLGELHGGSRRETFEAYPVVVECHLELNGVSVDLAYDSSMVEKRQIEFLSESFRYTLAQLNDSRRRRDSLGDIAAESPYQWDLEKIWTWNAVLPEAREMCMHELITRRASQNPLAPAVSAWDGQLTYEQLDDLSSRLAYQLVGIGVSGAVVPLIFEKSM